MMKRMNLSSGKPRGFTLVEAIVVLVLTGILSGILVLFIRQPVQNYTDVAGRVDLTDTADLALRRMARELRSALPNSIRVTSIGGVWWLQFIPTKAGLQYLALEDNAGPGFHPLDFHVQATPTFSVVGPMPTGTATIVANADDYVAIYNLGNGIAGADAYTLANVAQVTQVVQGATENTISMAGKTVSNPFYVPVGKVPNSSPDHRFSVINPPVTFRCEGKVDGSGTLTRIASTGFGGFSVAQPTPDLSSNPPKLASNVLGCDFSYTQTANLQTGLIGMTLTLARPRLGGAAGELEKITLVHQIHVDNTP